MKATTWNQLDSRSLAIFRMVLGALIFFDTVWRLPTTQDFLTDDGVLSRLDFMNSPYSDYWFSLHLGSGNITGQLVLSLFTALFAVGLAVGWRTNFMALGCWVMLNSLHARNPFINDRGDLQLAILLFWSVFLPLGVEWSLDKKQERTAFGCCKGVASAGLVFQFACIYLFAAILKTGDFWLARGDGLKFSLLSPMFSTSAAEHVSQWSDLTLRLLNYSVIAGEFFVAILLLSPLMVSLCRQLSVGLLVLFHLTVLVLFQLGLFPWIGALATVVLLPGEFWDSCRVHGSEGFSFARKPPLGIRIFLAICVGLSLLSNLAFQHGVGGLNRPKWVAHLTQKLKLEQHWDLFAPLPPINGTFRLIEVKPDNEVRVLFEGPPSQEKPDLSAFPGHRWKMLMLATIYPEFAFLREDTARVLAARQGRRQGTKLRYQFVLKPITAKGAFGHPVIQNLWVEP